MGMTDEYLDLIASGDKQRIECVLFSMAGGAVTGSLGAGLLFAPANALPVAGQAFNATAAGVGAVLGALGAGKIAIKYCGGDATKGSLGRLFGQARAPMEIVAPYEAQLQKNYGISSSDARLMSKAAVVYSANFSPIADLYASDVERRNAVALLVEKLRMV